MNQVLRAHIFENDHEVMIVQGDITLEDVDAIVNAANKWLKHGGGLAGIISRRGGLEIQRKSDLWIEEHGPVSHADPAYTTGGKLPYKYIIHAVGPIWGSGDEDNKLAAAVSNSLRVADELKLKSIALPAISTGIFGFPIDRAAGVIFNAIGHFFSQSPASNLELVRLTLFDQPTVDIFLRIWDDWVTMSKY